MYQRRQSGSTHTPDHAGHRESDVRRKCTGEFVCLVLARRLTLAFSAARPLSSLFDRPPRPIGPPPATLPADWPPLQAGTTSQAFGPAIAVGSANCLVGSAETLPGAGGARSDSVPFQKQAPKASRPRKRQFRLQGLTPQVSARFPTRLLSARNSRGDRYSTNRGRSSPYFFFSFSWGSASSAGASAGTTSSNSISKTSSEFAGMTGGRPRGP